MFDTDGINKLFLQKLCLRESISRRYNMHANHSSGRRKVNHESFAKSINTITHHTYFDVQLYINKMRLRQILSITIKGGVRTKTI